jgi:hypothetical protein
MMSVDAIVVWVCHECGYFRLDKTTGVHQTTNPDDPYGRLVIHKLVPETFTLLNRVREEQS